MREFSDWQIILALIGATKWTVLLSLVAFFGGAIVGLIFTVLRIAPRKLLNWIAILYINTIQSIPLLILLFICFFGMPLLGVDVSPWLAASISLIMFTSAFLADIWRGSVQAVPEGQWEAGKALGLSFLLTLRLIIAPQAIRLSIPPTVGFSVQVVKGTALAWIIGFIELTKAGTMLNNVTFRPFFVFAIVSLIYFALNYPLSWVSQRLERKLT